MGAAEWCARLLDVTPFVDSVEVLEILIEGATSIHLVVWDVLDENTLDVGRWQVRIALVHHIIPAEWSNLEKGMLLDLRAVRLAGPKTFHRVAIE